MALLKNTREQPAASQSGKHQLKLLKADPVWQSMLTNTCDFFDFKGQILAIQPHVLEFFSEHLSGLHIYSIGISLGSQKDRLFSPSPYLPFASTINHDAFDTYALDQHQALNYLFKNAISISMKDKKGYVLLNFNNHIIGLGKYAGNRINNLYPAEWKLRKMPEPSQYFTLAQD
jgi:NOL1/NOP2/fmu family ribosome biogenesis protein